MFKSILLLVAALAVTPALVNATQGPALDQKARTAPAVTACCCCDCCTDCSTCCGSGCGACCGQ